MLDDGLHPNGRGIAKMVERILPSVEKLIAEVKAAEANAK
jgi:acyl-CoA thioesterase-1